MIKRLLWKNVYSWGNDLQTLDFTKDNSKRILITSDNDNGQGKSSILDIMSYCLFGKTIREDNKKDIINDVNQKNMYIEGDIIGKNGENINIVRKRKTSKSKEDFIIKINGEELDQLKTKNATQEKLENFYLGITYEEYKQSVSLTTFNKNIMELSKDEKRKFFENIFNVNIISDVRDELVKEKNSLKKDKENLENKIVNLEDNIKYIKENISNIENMKENIEKDRKNEKEEINSNINENKNKLEELDKQYNELNEKYKKIEKKYNKMKNKHNKLKYALNYIDKREQYMKEKEENSKCDYCGSLLTKEHRDKILNKFKEKRKEINKKINNIDIDKYEEEYKKHKNKINKLNSNIKSINSQLEYLDKQYNKIDKKYDKKLNEINVDKYKKDLEEKDKNKKEFETKLEETKNKLNVYIFSVENVLCDQGFRKYIMNNYVYYVNSLLTNYISKFNFDFDISIDNELDININKFGIEKNYGSLSSGQKTIINIVLFFVVIKLKRLIQGRSINELYIDEFLDTNLADKNINLALDLINEIFKDDRIVIISHKIDNSEYFDKEIVVKRSGHFSEMLEN